MVNVYRNSHPMPSVFRHNQAGSKSGKNHKNNRRFSHSLPNYFRDFQQKPRRDISGKLLTRNLKEPRKYFNNR